MRKNNRVFKLLSLVLAAVMVAGLFGIGGPLSVDAAAMEDGKIVITYTGNTYQAPGDVAVIRGTNIVKLADMTNVQLVRLEDTGRDSSVGYIDRTAYDFGGVKDGSAIAPQANWDDAVTVDVFYTSPYYDSFQFIIPETDKHGNPMKHGIYAVKLTGISDTEIVYLNAPVIDYVLGSEGSFAAPGTLLEIVGENIAPCQNSNPDAVAADKRYKDRNPEDIRIVMRNKENRNLTYDMELVEITSDYNVVVRVPADIAVEAGSYSEWEVCVYNGYGNSTAWSVPEDLKIGMSWAEQIPDNFINIRDYGATGNFKENATPMIQNALNALAEMGGGTLYLPEGAYRIEHTIYIPGNVHLKGESVALTNILPVFLNDNHNDLPGTTVMFTGDNVEISDMSFYIKRATLLFNTAGNTPISNVRMNDLKFYTAVWGEANNSLGGTGALVDRLELWRYNESMTQSSAFVGGVYNNLRMVNINAKTNDNGMSLFNSYDARNTYGYFKNISTSISGIGWNRAIFSYAVWKDSVINGCTTTYAHNVYHFNCDFGPTTEYNREISVADGNGQPSYYYQIYTEPGLDKEDSVYLAVYRYMSVDPDGTQHFSRVNLTTDNVVASGFTVNQWADANMQIYIQNGSGGYEGDYDENYTNGLGQTRHVVGLDLERNCIIIDEPFADTSFSNAKTDDFQNPAKDADSVGIYNFCMTRIGREDMFWVDCSFYEGRCGISLWGGGADIVADGTHREYNFDVYLVAREGDVNWYVSYINEVWEATPYSLIASYGISEAPVSYSLKSQTRRHGQIGILLRNNDVSEMPISLDAEPHDQNGVIIDNNRFNDVEYLLWICKTGMPDGLTIYRNVGNELTAWLNANADHYNVVVTLFNNMSNLLDNNAPGKVESTMLGDVNGDAVVNTADADHLEQALANKITLLPTQIANADVDGNGMLSAQDVLYLRLYAAGVIATFPVENPSAGIGPDVEIVLPNGNFSPEYH